MMRESRKAIWIDPESRACYSPTTGRVLGDFSTGQMNWIESGGNDPEEIPAKTHV